MCQHNTCAHLTSIGCNQQGVAAVLFMDYQNPSSGKIISRVILLGKERAGAYANQFNFAAGKLDPSDNGCYIKALHREIAEEFKITIVIGPGNSFDKVFKDANGSFRTLNYNGTAIFVGQLFNGTSRGTLNTIITKHNNDIKNSWCLQEMECVDWFNINTLQQLEGKNYPVSYFVTGLIPTVITKFNL